MKNLFRVAPSLVVILMAACSSSPLPSSSDAMRTVTYRNETIQLARTYADFHDYSDESDRHGLTSLGCSDFHYSSSPQGPPEAPRLGHVLKVQPSCSAAVWAGLVVIEA